MWGLLYLNDITDMNKWINTFLITGGIFLWLRFKYDTFFSWNALGWVCSSMTESPSANSLFFNWVTVKHLFFSTSRGKSLQYFLHKCSESSGQRHSCISQMSCTDRSACIFLSANWARGLCSSLLNQFTLPGFFTVSVWPFIITFKTLRETTWRSQETITEHLHVVTVEARHIFHKFQTNEGLLSPSASLCLPHHVKVFHVDLLQGCSFY